MLGYNKKVEALNQQPSTWRTLEVHMKIVSCPECGRQFSTYQRKFCSKDCLHSFRKKKASGESNANFKNATLKKKCEICGKIIRTFKSQDRRFCSKKCTKAWHKRRSEKTAYEKNFAKLTTLGNMKLKIPAKYKRGANPIKICNLCRVVFFETSCRGYCEDCSTKKIKCVVCNKIMEVKPYFNKKTCSKACKAEHGRREQLGSKSHLWQGGKTAKSLKRRNCLPYKNWRKSVFVRDDYTCKMCNQKGGKLAAHHIKTVKDYPELIYEKTNGITLCWSCHFSIKGKEEEYEAIFKAEVGKA